MSSLSSLSISDEVVGMLELEVVSADHLPAMDLNMKADPYFTVVFANKEHYKSKTIKKTRSPVWNETVKLIVSQSEKNYAVTINVYDWDKLKDDYIGSVDIDISKFASPSSDWFEIHDKGKSRGKVHISGKMLSKQEVDKAFWVSFAKHFDTDESGAVNRVEFGALIGSIHPSVTEEEVSKMFDSAHLNGDKEMSFEEAYRILSTDAKLTAAVLGNDVNFIWNIYSRTDSLNSVGDLVLNKNLVHTHQVTADKADKKVILVHNRKNGKLEEEKIPHYIEVSLRIMYSTSSGRTAVENTQIRKLLNHLSVTQGKKYDDTRSVKEIPHFIAFHNLNKDEILDPLDSFKTMNEFFFRKLKPTARPIDGLADPSVIVSPADCRLNVFPTIDAAKSIWIKGKHFTLYNLLRDDDLVKKFDGGSLVIARLAPQDYHRFHIPIDCTVGHSTPIDGALYTVNPIAINTEVDVYTDNKRIVTVLDSPVFKTVVMIAVGATMVGSIKLTSHEGQKVKKGDEHGFFAFGGSTVLLLFEPNTVQFDNDLLVNSQKPIETLVAMGNHIGKKI